MSLPKSVHDNFLKIINSLDLNNQDNNLPKKSKKVRKKKELTLNTVSEIKNYTDDVESENEKKKKKKNENFNTGRWKPDEHQRFIEAILKYGNEWKSVQRHVITRSSTQARSHAQKFFVKIKKANIPEFNIDTNKNSIKTLHEIANQMNGDQYLNTVKTLNNIAFERKNNKEKRSRKKSSQSPIRLKKPKNDDFSHFTLDDRKPNIIINNNINNININISSPYPDIPLIKKRPRQNSIDLIFNSYDNHYNYNFKHDNEFNQLFESFNNDRDFELNDISTFIQIPKKFDFNLE